MCIYTRFIYNVYQHISMCTVYLHMYLCNVYPSISSQRRTGWRKCTRFFILIGHFPQKSPIIIGSLAQRDLQIKVSYASSPPCRGPLQVQVCFGGTSTNKRQALFTSLWCIPFWFLRIIVIYTIFVFLSDVGDSDGLEGFALWVKVNAKGLTGSRELKTSWIHALSLQVLSLQDTATRCNMLRHAALHCSTQSPQAYANSRRAGFLGATRQRQDIRTTMDALSCLIFIGLFSQKSPILIGPFAKRDRCLVATRQRQDIQTTMHRMPYLYRYRFFTKEPYDYWLFCETWPMSCCDKTATRLPDKTKIRHPGCLVDYTCVYNTRICLHTYRYEYTNMFTYIDILDVLSR